MVFVGDYLALTSSLNTHLAYFHYASLILDGLLICFSHTDCKQAASCNDYSDTSLLEHGCNSSVQDIDSDYILSDDTTDMERAGGPGVSPHFSFLLPPIFQ